ncbi:MAG: NADP-dependent oxidoreductase [Gammaproteobacteria bacterium]
MNETNRQWLLRERPRGAIDPAIFERHEAPVSAPGNGQVLARTLLLSFDPTQRGWMEMDTYMPAVAIGDPVRAGGIAQVIESRHPKYKPGDLVNGLCNWQDYVTFEPDAPGGLPPTRLPGHLDPALMLALGLTGLTAYFGLLDIGRPRAGDTVLVSGAAGATGSIAGQIAKIKGCRVIGIAGGEEKCRWLTERGRFDAAIDYKQGDIGPRLAELAPAGVDVYFDNVGGEILDTVLLQLADRARVVLCGAISQYEHFDAQEGIRNMLSLVIHRARAEGFIILDYLDRALPALLTLNHWVEHDLLRQEIDMQEGFENIPATLNRLFRGRNLGKQLLRVADPPLPVTGGAVERFAVGLLGRFYAWRNG